MAVILLLNCEGSPSLLVDTTIDDWKNIFFVSHRWVRCPVTGRHTGYGCLVYCVPINHELYIDWKKGMDTSAILLLIKLWTFTLCAGWHEHQREKWLINCVSHCWVRRAVNKWQIARLWKSSVLGPHKLFLKNDKGNKWLSVIRNSLNNSVGRVVRGRNRYS